jgi:hypothetical protein
MNVGLLFTVAMLLAWVVGFAMSAGSLRRRDRLVGNCTFTERGFHRVRDDRRTRIRKIGRQDVYLLCTNIELLEGSANGAEGRAA